MVTLSDSFQLQGQLPRWDRAGDSSTSLEGSWTGMGAEQGWGKTKAGSERSLEEQLLFPQGCDLCVTTNREGTILLAGPGRSSSWDGQGCQLGCP